jgi:hypothetical protein
MAAFQVSFAIKFVGLFNARSEGSRRAPAPLGCTADVAELSFHSHWACEVVNEVTGPTNYVCDLCRVFINYTIMSRTNVCLLRQFCNIICSAPHRVCEISRLHKLAPRCTISPDFDAKRPLYFCLMNFMNDCEQKMGVYGVGLIM